MKYDPTKKLEIYRETDGERLGYLNEKDDYIVVIPRESKFFESLVEFQNKMIETKELSCPSTPSTTESGVQTKSDEPVELSVALMDLKMQVRSLKLRSLGLETAVSQLTHYISLFFGRTLSERSALSNVLNSLDRELQENQREQNEPNTVG